MSKHETSDTQLSKKLSWLLRHGAVEERLPIQADGYVPVNAILQHPRYARHFTIEVIKRLVDKDEKQRYSLRKNQNNQEYEIRANQGHSMKSVIADKCLQRIVDPLEVPIAVHGTYYKNWDGIRENGLSCMTRNHIHFATKDKVDNTKDRESGVSGFRSNCQILIYLDAKKAMQEGGMEIYRSANDVILCAGKDGRITKEYFAKVVDRRSGTVLTF